MSISVNRPVDFPPSDRKYEKNGKKVRRNIGVPMATFLTTASAASVGVSYYRNIVNDKFSIANIKNNIKIYNLEGQELKKAEEAIEHYSKNIKSSKKFGWIASLVIAAVTIGTVLYTNHSRNKKREQLYNEPVK